MPGFWAYISLRLPFREFRPAKALHGGIFRFGVGGLSTALSG